MMRQPHRGGGRGATGDSESLRVGAHRGGGCGRGRGNGSGRGSLTVTRFDPSASTWDSSAGVVNSSATARTATGDDNEEVATGTAPSPRDRRKKRKAVADVNPTFAQVFRGGPRRRESDLPERDDEGQEMVLPTEPGVEEGHASGLPWLSSLGKVPGSPAPSEPERPIEETVSGELGWLTSLKASGGKPSAGVAPTPLPGATGATQATSYVGKPLENVPPFWRTAPSEQLEHELQQKRSALWLRLKRLSKDAKRMEQKYGRARAKPQQMGLL